MKNKKLIPFEVIENHCRRAGSGRHSIAALYRTYKVPVYLSGAYQRRYTGQIKVKTGGSYIEVPF